MNLMSLEILTFLSKFTHTPRAFDYKLYPKKIPSRQLG